MTDLAVQNIANFCGTKHTKYKKSLKFDFIFELLKESTLYAVVSTYKNLYSMLKIPGYVRPY